MLTFSANFNLNGQRCTELSKAFYPISLRGLIRNTIFLRLPSFIYSYVFSVLFNQFFFTRFCFISVALSVTTDRNVSPEGLKFRILFRGQLIWKRHLSSSLKKHNQSIFEFSGHWTTLRCRLSRDLYRIWPLKFTDYRISIYDCIFKVSLLYRRRESQECTNNSRRRV